MAISRALCLSLPRPNRFASPTQPAYSPLPLPKTCYPIQMRLVDTLKSFAIEETKGKSPRPKDEVRHVQVVSLCTPVPASLLLPGTRRWVGSRYHRPREIQGRTRQTTACRIGDFAVARSPGKHGRRGAPHAALFSHNPYWPSPPPATTIASVPGQRGGNRARGDVPPICDVPAFVRCPLAVRRVWGGGAKQRLGHQTTYCAGHPACRRSGKGVLLP